MSDEEGSSLSKTQLVKKHQKELKDLKRKTDMMLKKAPKANKKTVLEEIAKLEKELDEKHQLELASFGTVGETEPDETLIASSVEEVPKLKKKSRAQKRREAKANEDMERERRIEEEKSKVVNLGALEHAEIEKQIASSNLIIKSVPANGDCLYNSLVTQLEINDRGNYKCTDLRELAAEYMVNHKEEFLPFLDFEEDQYDSFCEKVRNHKGYWAGQLEIRALCESLKTPIHIYSNEVNSPIKMGEDFENTPLLISYHRQLYSLGEHYNTIVPK